MKQYLSEEQTEDELVKIKAYDWQRILDGQGDPSIYMSNNEVPLSKAVERIEEYLAEMENRGAITDKVYFIVRACRDDFLMFRYEAEEGIKEDYRGEERPKNPEKVWILMRDASKEGYSQLSCEKETYAEFAVRDMEKMLAEFDMEKHRKWKGNENLRWEDIYFDVYEGYFIVGYGYLYSYKDGKKYIRPLNENENESEKLFERYKKVRLKVLLDTGTSPRVLVEQEIQSYRAEYYMNLYWKEAKRIEEEAKEKGESQEPVPAAENIYFELYDGKTGALWKTYRIVGGKIEEDTSSPAGWDLLPFMKKAE